MSGITRDEWLKALEAAGFHHDAGDQSALTTLEFAKLFGLPRHTASRRLEALIASGRAVRTHKWCLDRNGRSYCHIAYRLLDDQPKKKR